MTSSFPFGPLDGELASYNKRQRISKNIRETALKDGNINIPRQLTMEVCATIYNNITTVSISVIHLNPKSV